MKYQIDFVVTVTDHSGDEFTVIRELSDSVDADSNTVHEMMLGLLDDPVDFDWFDYDGCPTRTKIISANFDFSDSDNGELI